ncbi:MAG: Asp-tRNA(Asn)/Glu-tRNA(Gln) amidotransferase subunit GatB [Chloroflexi bacterium]|nr:Asp-tRNA(Asn)/Glu-tRNA(Gln) amidotransferase subunit GatB [Chloroflexota bacterium]MBM3174130.1 Asp-tRNA(Asn)/Glu-tRNA(Gln) amidotransferase subunit GatB [Chloroflexota bacterium]MBM4449198.1 Asp-tRNA(Asn)/Glu-tRNA(Gln) amidotransferase subunit GatB [Chloroflexota bacterium]
MLTDVVEYETVIGLEVHAQLLTRSKMFCPCSADYANTAPNTHVCPICLGMPGVLPSINQKAIEYTVMTALALNCTIAEHAKFDRKNYPYPDLMKGYQISQYDAPIGEHGWLMLDIDGKQRKVGITRVHLEEDVAKLLHRTSSTGESYSLVDVNRAGVPLMEIVGEPDISSPEEARQYLMKLRAILQYLVVSTGNMEEGSFRCDANISIRPKGSKEYLSKVEVKNMNSFKAVYRALDYEAQRQREVLEKGSRLVQETRGWVDDKGITVSQRSKEYAHDYRYFPEPDLPPMVFERAWVEKIRSHLPELPDARRDRFMSQYGLPLYDANLLVDSTTMANYFEECMRLIKAANGTNIEKKAKTVSNWLLGDLSHLLNATNTNIEETRVSPKHLLEMLALLEQGTLSGPAAKAVFEEMFHSGKQARDIVTEKGLSQISDSSEIDKIVEEIIANNSQAVSDFAAGKEQALTFLVGQVMKASKGRANPNLAKEILLAKVGGKRNV